MRHFGFNVHDDFYYPHWLPVKQFPTYEIPLALRPFLFEKGSMTQFLRSKANQTLKVEILNQAWQKPQLSEQKILDLDMCAVSFVRETIIYCYDEPWMYGRSVFPVTTLTGKNKFLLKALDQRPLGDILYRDPYLQRKQFELARLESLWGRRSIFIFNQKPLLVTEVLLPAGEKALKASLLISVLLQDKAHRL